MKKLLLVAVLGLGLLAPASAVVQGTRVGNANYTVLNTDTTIVTTTTFSAQRTWTLPFAAGSCVGQNCKPFANQLTIIDSASAINGSSTLVLARQSGDTINGAASDLTITTAGVQLMLVPTSANNWQIYTIGSSGGNVGPLTVTTLTADAVAGGDASLGVTGLAAAQGGAIVVTGGTSSTSGNAGGAVSLVGGTPGATGVGGAVSITGAIGGASSGAAGKASVVGGAGTAGNATGGAAELISGAGQGSANGGVVTITSGAAGATGVAGVVNISVGAATAGAGSSVNIAAGNGAGGTAAGGDVDLIPGDAVSTGVPGTVKVNGNASLICATYIMDNTPAAADATFFVATRPLLLMTARQTHSVAAGGASTMQITKDGAATAPGGGTDLLTAAFDLNTTANTPLAGSITTVVADKTFAAGDRLSVDYADAVQASVGVVVTACFAPL